jgi:hypothetical protein
MNSSERSNAGKKYERQRMIERRTKNMKAAIDRRPEKSEKSWN